MNLYVFKLKLWLLDKAMNDPNFNPFDLKGTLEGLAIELASTASASFCKG
jgi:hypothetical protein